MLYSFIGLLREDINMFTLWGKLFKENRLIGSSTIYDSSDETRTHKVFNSLDKICLELDLNKPIWLDKNINDFKKFSRTRFTQDSFIEEVDFDYLEIHVIDE